MGAVGNFVGSAASSIKDAVTRPFEQLASSTEKVVTDPLHANLGDFVSAANPLGATIVNDVKHPEDAAVQAGAAAAGAATYHVLSAGAAAGATAATPVSALATVAQAAPAAAAAGGGGGFFATLGTASLLSTLTQVGQKAQGLIATIPGASSILPGLLSMGGLSPDTVTALGPNEVPPAATGNDRLKQLGLGVLALVVPLGVVAWLAWRWWKRRRK